METNPGSIDQVLESISQQLHLSKETETEVLAEIRTHLEDAVSEAASRGEDKHEALLKAAEEFGIEEAGAELQKIHSSWESIGALLATGLPVLLALVLRWLAFAPDGSARNWPQLLAQPDFYILAIAALVLPILFIRRRRLALVGWGVFWLLTVIFVIFPSINHW
jgi:hypothetical protein